MDLTYLTPFEFANQYGIAGGIFLELGSQQHILERELNYYSV